MNDSTATVGYAHSMARMLAEAGYKLVPIPAGFKYPKGFGRWQEIATDDVAQIDEWFKDTTHGIGLALGRQPNGKFLFAIDVDGRDGMDNLIDLLREHGGQDTFLNTANQNTGGDGAHFIFQSDFEIRNSASKFADKIDLRGEGGQIVVGPTIHPNGNPYVWNHTLADREPLHAPQWVMDRIAEVNEPKLGIAEPESKSGFDVTQLDVRRETSQAGLDVNPLDFMCQKFSVYDWLLGEGWQPGRRKGDEEQMTRPDKDPREGGSATMHHDDNWVFIFTTSVPPGWDQVGKRQQSGFSINGFDAWMIENGYTNVAEAMRTIRKQLMPSAPVTGLSGADPSEAGGDRSTEEHPHVTAGLNLPDEFWESRDWLSTIRQAAHSRMLSADAILGAVFTRFATVIPPQYKIPAIVGSASTFDHISILVGRSGAGKSAAMAVARELYEGPQKRKDIVWDIPVPSGEGLVGAFFEFVDETVDGKKVRKNRKTKNAVHFSIDEAMALVSAGKGRQGATIGSVLCTAWSGGNPGQTNASVERDRQGMVPFSFRMSGLAGVQMALGHHLLDDQWVHQGLSGRLVFFAAEDPTIPLDTPPFPEPLDIEVPPTVPVELVYADEIVAEVREQHHLKVTGQIVEDAIDGHQRLIQLKLSGIIALIEGRSTVTPSDWELAKTVASYSRRIRTVMLEHKRQQESDESHRKAKARGYYRAVEEETMHSDRVKRCKEAIVRALTRYPGLQRREIKNKLDRSLVRDGVIGEALDQLEADGVIHRPKRGEKGGFRLLD